MCFQLNLATKNIAEVSSATAVRAMKIFGYAPSTINRLATEATVFYTGDTYYARDRYRLDELLREDAATRPTA